MNQKKTFYFSVLFACKYNSVALHLHALRPVCYTVTEILSYYRYMCHQQHHFTSSRVPTTMSPAPVEPKACHTYFSKCTPISEYLIHLHSIKFTLAPQFLIHPNSEAFISLWLLNSWTILDGNKPNKSHNTCFLFHTFEDGCLLACSTMYTGISLPTFQMSVLPALSGPVTLTALMMEAV
jgi:hypothetical protein